MTDVIIYLGAFLVSVAAGAWFAANLPGWWLGYRRDGEPFGRRVFLGPDAYDRWLDGKNRATRGGRR